MQTVSLESHVGADGMLHLHVPVMVRERNVEVLVVVQPLELNGHAGKSEEVDANGWPVGFLERTYGCLADDPIERWPQGEYEIREEIA